MRQRHVYDDAFLNNIKRLRANNMSWSNVAKEVGISIKSLYPQMAKRGLTGDGAKQKPGPKPGLKKAILRKAKVNLTPAVVSSYKPMIALVGSPDEITKTIRELFS